MLPIDASLSKAIEKYVPGKSAVNNYCAVESHYQQQMNEIVDDLLRQCVITNGSLQIPVCISATRLELDAFRTNLLQRCNILTGAYSRDWTEETEKSVDRYGRMETETVKKEKLHSCSHPVFKIAAKMGWDSSIEKSICWAVTLNWGETPLGSVPREVNSYIQEMAEDDPFIKEESSEYRRWVHYRIQSAATGVYNLFQAGPHTEPIPPGGQGMLSKCIFATESEMEVLSQQIYQMYRRTIEAKSCKDPDHLHEDVLNLSGVLGGLHHPSESSHYQLLFHRSFETIRSSGNIPPPSKSLLLLNGSQGQ